jgi:hypothetical protein
MQRLKMVLKSGERALFFSERRYAVTPTMFYNHRKISRLADATQGLDGSTSQNKTFQLIFHWISSAAI